MTKIKICGIRRSEDIQYVNQLLPDYIGFIFAEKRPKRYIQPSAALELKKNLNPSIKTVGVFVDEPLESVMKIAQTGVMDLIQLHGSEDKEYISQLRTFWNGEIIKAYRIENESDVSKAENDTADYVLLDNGIGGTGTAFQWSLIERFSRPFFLAGGLDSSNVAQAISTLSPFAVDTSSGVETDGVKDYNKINSFIKAVKSQEV